MTQILATRWENAIGEERDFGIGNGMKCEKCGTENASYAAFCMRCGVRIVQTSSSQPHYSGLGQLTRPPMQFAFCKFCGSPLAPGALRCLRCGRWFEGRPVADQPQSTLKEQLAGSEGSDRYCSVCRTHYPREMAYCSRCGRIIDPQARRLIDTELPMIIVCDSCGAKNMRTDNLCRNCDKSLADAKKKALEVAENGPSLGETRIGHPH